VADDRTIDYLGITKRTILGEPEPEMLQPLPHNDMHVSFFELISHIEDDIRQTYTLPSDYFVRGVTSWQR